MNKVSYETLNKDDKEKKMKRNLVMGGLILCLLLGVVGCKEDPPPVIKTVDPAYWGEYWDLPEAQYKNTHKLLVKEKEIILTNNARPKDEDITVWGKTYAAYTEEDGSFIRLYYDRTGDGNFRWLGDFPDENTFMDGGMIYWPRQQ